MWRKSFAGFRRISGGLRLLDSSFIGKPHMANSLNNEGLDVNGTIALSEGGDPHEAGVAFVY